MNEVNSGLRTSSHVGWQHLKKTYPQYLQELSQKNRVMVVVVKSGHQIINFKFTQLFGVWQNLKTSIAIG